MQLVPCFFCALTWSWVESLDTSWRVAAELLGANHGPLGGELLAYWVLGWTLPTLLGA